MFLIISKKNFCVQVVSILSSANAFKLDKSKNLSLGKELNDHEETRFWNVENGEIAGNKHFLLLTQSFPNSQGKNSIIMKFYCLANSYHTQTSRYNNFSFISANIYSIFFGNRVLELIASPVLHINYITYIKIVSGSMFYSGNRLVQYSCRVTTLLTYCPIYWNNLVYFTSQGRRVRPETAQISIYKFTLNMKFWTCPV